MNAYHTKFPSSPDDQHRLIHIEGHPPFDVRGIDLADLICDAVNKHHDIVPDLLDKPRKQFMDNESNDIRYVFNVGGAIYQVSAKDPDSAYLALTEAFRKNEQSRFFLKFYSEEVFPCHSECSIAPVWLEKNKDPNLLTPPKE